MSLEVIQIGKVEQQVRHQRLTQLSKMVLEYAREGYTFNQIDKMLRNFASVAWGASINTQREYAQSAINIAAQNYADAKTLLDVKTFNDNILETARQIIVETHKLDQKEAPKLIQNCADNLHNSYQ